MAIVKIARTTMTCDVCKNEIVTFCSWTETGWLKHFARKKGATVGKRHVCRECRIKEKIEKCTLIKKVGNPKKDGDACMGFGKSEIDDEPCEKCKKCIANNLFDWDEYERQVDESLYGRYKK